MGFTLLFYNTVSNEKMTFFYDLMTTNEIPN